MAHSRNLVVIALVSILIGAFASIGALQYAEVVAYAGVNPNTADDAFLNPRTVTSALRWRRLGNMMRAIPVKQAESPEQTYGAAPTVVEPTSDECTQTGNAKRRAACNAGTKLINETNR
jgi:hypothetical protein